MDDVDPAPRPPLVPGPTPAERLAIALGTAVPPAGATASAASASTEAGGALDAERP